MMEQDVFAMADSFAATTGFSESPEAAKPKEGVGPFNIAEAVIGFKRNGSSRGPSAASLFVEKVRDLTLRLVRRVFHFGREALEIAVSKFMVELCAMIIAAIGKTMMDKHKKNVDITTSGVFYGPGQVTTPGGQTPGGQQSSIWGNNFDNGWNRSGW